MFFAISNCAVLAQQESFPYTLNYSDIALISVGGASTIGGYYLDKNKGSMSLDELNALDYNDINSFDQSATKQWNTSLDNASNIFKYGIAATPCLLIIPQVSNKQFQNSFIYASMYFETALFTLGVTNLTKSLSNRTRPYLYNPEIDQAYKEDVIKTENVYDSFYSGHTAISFATAVFLSKTYTDIYGKNTWSKVIWASSLSVATTVGFMRYKSGQHFPTDIITGAIIGSVIGYTIPLLHKKKNDHLSLFISANNFHISYLF